MKRYVNKDTLRTKVKQIAEENAIKRRYHPHEVNILYGSGEQPASSNYKFFNTFGKDFAGTFNPARLEKLSQCPDDPIDMRFMEDLDLEQIQEIQAKCPQARFLMNDVKAFEITLKLVIQNVKLSNSTEKA